VLAKKKQRRQRKRRKEGARRLYFRERDGRRKTTCVTLGGTLGPTALRIVGKKTCPSLDERGGGLPPGKAGWKRTTDPLLGRVSLRKY